MTNGDLQIGHKRALEASGILKLRTFLVVQNGELITTISPRSDDRVLAEYGLQYPEFEPSFFSISCLATPDDNGFCVTFKSKEQRDACAAQMRSEGCYHVSEWQS